MGRKNRNAASPKRRRRHREGQAFTANKGGTGRRRRIPYALNTQAETRPGMNAPANSRSCAVFPAKFPHRGQGAGQGKPG